MKKYFIFFIIVISISSLMIFNKLNLIKINIIINFFLIILFLFDNIINNYKLKINKIIITYFILILFSIISLLWSIDFNISIYTIIRMFSLIASMFSVYNLLKRYDLLETIPYSIWLVSIINYIFLFGITFNVEAYVNERFVGTLNNSNVLAEMMIYSVFFSIIYLNKKISILKKILLLLNIIMAIYVLILTISRMGTIIIIFLIISSIIISFVKPGKLLKVSILSIVIILPFLIFFDFQKLNIKIDYLYNRFELGINVIEKDNSKNFDNSTQDRIRFIKIGKEIFYENPILGKGIGTFISIEGGHYSHNNYIELSTGIGIIGVLIYYIIYILLLNSVYRMKPSFDKKMFIIYLVILFVMDLGTVSYYSRINFMIMLYFVVYSEKNINANNKKIVNNL